jgi:hypothetical protein
MNMRMRIGDPGDCDQWEGFINEYYRAENALTDLYKTLA